MKKPGGVLIQSLGRAFSILELFAGDNTPLSLTVISERVGLHKSTCFGLVNTLEQLGYLLQEKASGKYRLGVKTLVLGQSYLKGQDVRQVAGQAVLPLAALAQEFTIHVVVREKDNVVYVDKYEGAHAMVIVASSIGQRAILHCTGVGKAVLAFMTPAERDAILAQPLAAFTPSTLINVAALLENLRDIRERGFSIDDEERAYGLRCVAAPFFNSDGKVIGAVSISGPSSLLSRERLLELSEPIKKAAAFISRGLGYLDEWPPA